MESDFHKIKRILTQMKIHFTPRDAEPRFEIHGGLFTTQKLIQMGHEKKLTNLDLSEEARRGTRSAED
jgi:hypothetical protein